MHKHRQPDFGGRIEQLLDLPAGTLSDEPRLELSGQRQFRLEGPCEIRDCETDTVTVKTGCGLLRLRGRDLCITVLTNEELRLQGLLLSLEFLG